MLDWVFQLPWTEHLGTEVKDPGTCRGLEPGEMSVDLDTNASHSTEENSFPLDLSLNVPN